MQYCIVLCSILLTVFLTSSAIPYTKHIRLLQSHQVDLLGNSFPSTQIGHKNEIGARQQHPFHFFESHIAQHNHMFDPNVTRPVEDSSSKEGTTAERINKNAEELSLKAEQTALKRELKNLASIIDALYNASQREKDTSLSRAMDLVQENEKEDEQRAMDKILENETTKQINADKEELKEEEIEMEAEEKRETADDEAKLSRKEDIEEAKQLLADAKVEAEEQIEPVIKGTLVSSQEETIKRAINDEKRVEEQHGETTETEQLMADQSNETSLAKDKEAAAEALHDRSKKQAETSKELERRKSLQNQHETIIAAKKAKAEKNQGISTSQDCTKGLSFLLRGPNYKINKLKQATFEPKKNGIKLEDAEIQDDGSTGGEVPSPSKRHQLDKGDEDQEESEDTEEKSHATSSKTVSATPSAGHHKTDDDEAHSEERNIGLTRAQLG